MKKLVLLSVLFFGMVLMGYSQVSISPGSTITESFSIGTSTTASLPAGWKVDKNTTVRSVGTYSSAVTATEQRAGNSMSSSATNGIYNYAAGDPLTATERAVGGLSSSSASKSVNVYVQLTNNGAVPITEFTISYNVEKYRNGSNTAGFSIQMYYSANGTSWTSAGSNFLTSFIADADNNGYVSAPGSTVSISNKTLNQLLAVGNSLYLAWNYSVATGTTTSNAQALGIDDVTITATAAANSITLSPITQNFGPFCNSIANSVALTYTTSGTVTSPSIELSNSSGSFTSGATNLGGTVTSGSLNTITTSIPQNQDPGTYRIRIVSTDLPAIVSSNNGSDIILTGAVTPSVSINDPGSVCPTQSVTFTPVPQNLGGSTASYSWTINGVTGSASGDTYTQSIWETGNSVQAVMTVTGGCVISATASSNLVAPTVTSNTPSVSIAITTGSNPTCTGSSIIFTATPANLGGGTVSYQWKKNGSNDGTNSPTYLLTPDNNDQVSCEITVIGGCVTSNTATSGTTTITVNQIPATPVVSSNSPVCAGGILNLTSDASGTISWTGPNSFISSEQNPSIESVTSAAGGTYNVTSTVEGCVSLAGSTSVVVNAAPAILTHPESVSITEGNSHTFTILASGNGLTFKWFENSIEIPSATSSTYTVTGAILGMSGFSYSCEVTGTCAPSVTSNVAILTVIPPPIAGWDMSTQLTYGISPLTATFTADNITVGQLTKGSGIMGGGTAAARAWGGGTSSTWAISSEASIANGAYFTFTVQANSEYSLSLSAINPFDYRRSGTGPPSGLIQYKLNSGTFIDITTVSFSSSSSTGGSIGSTDLSGFSELQNLTPSTLVTFRVVLFGANPGGTWYIFDKTNSTANDFALIGTVSLLTITTTTTADNKSVCSGTTSVNLTATVSPDPGGGTVQFKIDGGNVGSPQAVQSGGTASFTYDPSALGAGDHTIGADFSGNGSYQASSGSATLTIFPASSATDHFRSKISGNWSNASTWESSADGINWCDAGAAPTSLAADIAISGGHTVSIDAPATASSLQLSGILGFTDNNTLSISGNFAGSGTFNCGTGTVDFTGTSPQLIPAFTYNHLTTTNAGTKSLGGNVIVNGILTTNTSSKIDANGSNTLTLKGNWNHNGTFEPSTGNVIFNSNSSQVISASYIIFNDMTVQCAGTVKVPEYTYINNLYLVSGKFTLNYSGNANVNFASGGSIQSTGGNFNTVSSNDDFNFMGAMTISGTVDFYQDINLHGPTDFGTGSTVRWYMHMMNGSSVINHPPSYGSSSVLAYTLCGSTVERGLEWSATIGPGYPNHVIFGCSPGTTLNMGTTVAQIAGQLTINWLSHLNMGSNPNPLTVLGNVQIEQGGTLTLSTVPGGDIKIGGSWIRYGGSVFNHNNRTVFLIGTSQQGISNEWGETFPDLVIQKPTGEVALGNNLTISNQLTFASGNNANISLNNKTLLISNSAPEAIHRQGNGYVMGILKRAIATGDNTYDFPVGFYYSGYTPVRISFHGVMTPGTLAVQSNNGDHTSLSGSTINPSKTANRNWSVVNTGIGGFSSYDAEFTFLNPSDLDAGANPMTFMAGKFDGGSWTYPTMGTRTSTSAQIIGVTGFSDFQLGNSNCTEPDVPSVNANPTILCAGSSSLLSITAGNLNDAINWNWYSGSCSGTLVGTGTSLVVYPSSTTTYYARGEGGCVTPGLCAEITIIVNPTAVVSGYYNYYNTGNTALNDVSIELKQSGVYKYGTSTNSSGYFEFPNVCPGTYDVVSSKTKVIGGVNSTDAAQVNYWTAHHSFIEKVRFLAGDVDGSTNLWSDDAGSIQQYFITQGNPNPAFDSDWSFWKTGDLINANPGPSGYPTITVPAGTGSVTQNFYGLVTGDFNRSYVPGSSKSGSESLMLTYGDIVEVGLGAEIELPLYTVSDIEVGAISLILEFPSDVMEVNGVYLSDDPGNPVPFMVSGDEVRIGWNSITPSMVDEGSPLVTLILKVNEPTGEEGILLKLAADPLNELADGSFEVISNAVLVVDVIKTTATGLEENTVADKLTLANHPNPFRGTTSFSYSLPVDGKVTLEIHDIVGNKVKVLVDEMQAAGNYLLKMEQSDVQPGVYTATIRVESFGDAVRKTIKIINKNN